VVLCALPARRQNQVYLATKRSFSINLAGNPLPDRSILTSDEPGKDRLMSSRTINLASVSRRRIAVAAVVFSAGFFVLPKQSVAADLEWTIAPYLWASDVGLDITVNNDPVIGTNVPFNDLVDKLDGAFMLHLEMKGDRFGTMFDSIYIKLADNAVVPVGPGGPILGDVLVSTDLTLTLYEFAAFYRFGSNAPGSSAFDILAGVRQVDIDQNLAIVLPGPGMTPVGASIDISETDFIIGGRLAGSFNDRWSYRIRADYGSGGTEGTINALAAVGYTFGQTGLFSLELGYRYFDLELKKDADGSLLESDLTMSGPMLGLVFRF